MNRLKTEDLQEQNLGRAQVCFDAKFGIIMRSYMAKYFYPVSPDKAVFIKKNSNCYVFFDDNAVPRSMIRMDPRMDDKIRVMCSGCGKMFPKREMDGSLCRGFDGCSVRHEISQLRATNVQRRETDSRHDNCMEAL